MRKFDLSLRSSRSSYFATFRHQLTILSKTDALDEEKWLNMLGTFVKDWFRYESHFVHGRDSLVDILNLAAEGRKANDSHADCYQYFCVPEYGTANGRLHFHAVHFMRTLPTGSVDPNFGRRVRNRRQLNSLQNTWPYGYSMPIAVRYTQDAFSRSGWLWP